MRCSSKVLSVTFGLSLLLSGGCQATGWIPWVHSSKAVERAASEKTVHTHGLALTLRLNPVPTKLSATPRMEATLRLENVSKRFIQLEFASAQRFDVLVRDAAGRVVVQWSEDRMFDMALGYVGINPGERLEYQAAFSTRDLQPGKPYVVTALVTCTGHDDLKVELPLVPEK